MKHLIADCNIQLGDNPNFYQGSAYIGYTLEIPVRIVDIVPSEKFVIITISTSVIETLKGDGHYVYINDQLIGRLKDLDNDETEIITIPTDRFEKLIGQNKFMLFKIRMDTWEKGGESSGLLDDFLIKKIEIENAIPKTSIIVS